MSEGSKRAINMVKQAQTQRDYDDPWYRHEQKNERMVTKEDLLKERMTSIEDLLNKRSM